MLMYTSQKCSIHQHNKTIIMRDIRYFINSSFPIQLQASQVHYMKLINENLDSDKTMSLVAEEVLEKFEDKVQDGWVVLVGDGKTYQHLMNIKTTYGKALDKLLIFPGDWHILKNFQPVLMKLYYNAGLRELAKASGFQDATLTALESRSNFKHAHGFFKFGKPYIEKC